MEFGPSLVDSIIEKIGARKEVWLVFDMDGTLAYWKKLKAGDVFSLRPTVIPFLQTLLDSGIKTHFAIYSNNQAKSKVETIGSTIEHGLTNKSLFDVCFHFYNHFKSNPEETDSRKRRSKVNMNVSSLNEKRQAYNTNKTVESILDGFTASGAPLTEEDVSTHLFFFDDVDYPSIRAKIGGNYIQVAEFRGETPVVAAEPSRGTKRNRNKNTGAASKKPKARKTKRRAH